MSRRDRYSDYLETGHGNDLAPEERARLDSVREALQRETTWERPPPGLGDMITDTISRETERRRLRRWLLGAAAVVILVVGAVALLQDRQDESGVVAVVTMTGTELAPDAFGTAGLIPTPNGWAIDFDVTGLPPAPDGTFYQAWVNDGSGGVAVGTFHMRSGDPAPIALWSGVDLREYRTLNITLQEEGAGPEPSGKLVMTGTADAFEG